MANETDKLGILLETESGGSGFQEFRDELKETEQKGQESAEKIETSYTEAMQQIRNVSAVAFAAVGAAIGLSVREAAAAEQGMIGYRAAVRKAGGDADAFAEQIDEAAMRLQRLTGIADDEFIEVATRMTDVTGNASGAIANLGLVADLAAARKIDLASAGDMVARAMEGEVGMLSRMLPGLQEQVTALGENADKADIAAVIFERLAVFEGRAAEMADSTTGSFNILKQEVAATTEAVGGAFLESVRGATDGLTGVVKGVGDWAKEHEGLVGVIGGGALTVAGFLAVATSIALIAPRVVEGLAMIRTAAIALAASPWTIVAAGIIAVGAVAWQLSDAMTATAKSEGDLNRITKETGVSYDELRYKQEEIFGKFADYKSGTDEQRAAWDNYVLTLNAAKTPLADVATGIETIGVKAGTSTENIKVNATALRDLMNAGLDFDTAMSLSKSPVMQPVEVTTDTQDWHDKLLADENALNSNLAQSWVAMEQAKTEASEKASQERQDKFLRDTDFLQSSYRGMVQTFADTDMTGKERREQIWNMFKANVVGKIGEVTANYIFGEMAKRAATAATATTAVAASATAGAAEQATAGAVTTSWMQAAYAKLVAFYAWAGPVAPALAIGTIGAAMVGLGAIAAQVMGAIKMQEGGIVPGSGSGDRVPALLEPGERVINREQYNANRSGIEGAIQGGGGGGNNYHFHLDKEAALDQVLRIRELFEEWAVPVIEGKMREGAFAMKGVPL